MDEQHHSHQRILCSDKKVWSIPTNQHVRPLPHPTSFPTYIFPLPLPTSDRGVQKPLPDQNVLQQQPRPSRIVQDVREAAEWTPQRRPQHAELRTLVVAGHHGPRGGTCQQAVERIVSATGSPEGHLHD